MSEVVRSDRDASSPRRECGSVPRSGAAADEDTASRIRDHLEEHRGDLLDFLVELVSRESPSTLPEAQEPVFRLLEEGLRAAGLSTRRIPGRATGGSLLARPAPRERGRPVQLLLGHGDTVWPVGTLDEMPVELEDDRLRGPGVFDMKGGLAQTVFALRALHELGLEPPVTPVFLVTSDEEVGSPESRRWIERYARAACRAYVMEPAMDLDGKLKTARRGTGHFTIRIRGKGAHSGMDPEEGASAIVELSHVIQALHALNDPERGVSVNVGVIEGGQRANVVAPASRAEVDIRMARREDAGWLEERVRSLQATVPGTRLEIEGEVSRPPMERTPRNRRLWKRARREGLKLGLELDDCTSGGASDGNFVSLYTATLDGLGPVGDGAHASHEFVFTDALVERSALVALLLLLPAEDAAGDGHPRSEDAGGDGHLA